MSDDDQIKKEAERQQRLQDLADAGLPIEILDKSSQENVAQFPDRWIKPDDLWQCNCGCATFYYSRSGHLICSECDIVQTLPEDHGR